ncbi:MAG TPA: hypothetical protein PKE55_06805 [Kiritimatiellia bacterium]|nr:hypothetical protein [Kiritimatiellia bacterium]
MKKILASALLGACLLLAVQPVQAASSSRGGFMGFIAGCCFGIRTGAAYNDGKEIHWREWIMLVPVANLVFAVWNGVEGANGITTQELANRYGSTFY